jgi:hypothetical protein
MTCHVIQCMVFLGTRFVGFLYGGCDDMILNSRRRERVYLSSEESWGLTGCEVFVRHQESEFRAPVRFRHTRPESNNGAETILLLPTFDESCDRKLLYCLDAGGSTYTASVGISKKSIMTRLGSCVIAEGGLLRVGCVCIFT